MEISGHDFVAMQTKQIERLFKCSRPRPRNKAMGFRDETQAEKDAKRRQWREWLEKKKATTENSNHI